MSLSIAYHAKAGVDEAKDDDIIEFSDGIYKRLEQWCYLEDSNDFLKERLTTSRIVKSCKLVSMGNTPIFAYSFQISCASSFVRFTLLTRFSNLWYKKRRKYMVKLTAFMYPSRAAYNFFAFFLFKPKYTRSFLSILEIFSIDFAEALRNLIF